MFSFWPSFSLLIFFLVIFLECRAVGARVTLPLKSFLLFFGYGCIGAPLLALLLQQIPIFQIDAVGSAGSEALSRAAWLSAPPIEEFAKAFPVLVLAFLKRESRRLSIADLTLAGFASGAGFGFVEANLNALANGTPASFQHLSGFGFETAQRMASDYVVTFAGHPVYPALIGLAAAAGLRFLPARRDLSWIPAFCVFLLASFDHGMFNWKTLNPESALGGFPDAPRAVELLYVATLHGRLETWLLLLGLLAAQIAESWLCAKAVGRRPDLLLRFEIGPWFVNEWLVAVLRFPAGRVAFVQTLAYFRRRRAFALATLESKRYPNERALARHARFLELRLKRERQILRAPPRGVWLPPWPILKRSLQNWAWRTRGVLAFAVLFFFLFMLGQDQLPHALRQFLFGRVFTAVVVALGLGFAGWGIFRIWRAPRPDLVATESADYVGYHARLFLLGASLASGLFPALSLILGWKALVPGAAYLSSYLPGWIGQGGNPNTLMGLGAMGGAVEWDVNPTSEALRHEIATGEERIRRLERQIEASLSSAKEGEDFERKLAAFLELMADLDAERDAHEHRKLALDEAERQAAEKSGEDPGLAVQAVKDEFQRLDRELGAAAAVQLARIAAFEDAYAKAWAEIMRHLDACDATRAQLSEPLNALWRAHKDPAWALRVAAIADETVLPSLALLIPELEAIASEDESEHGNHLRAAITRIRAANTKLEEPAAEAIADEVSFEEAAQAAELEISEAPDRSAEEWSGSADETAASPDGGTEVVPQLDLFAPRAVTTTPEQRTGANAHSLRFEEEQVEIEDSAFEAEERTSDRSSLDDESFYDLESIAPQPYHAVLPSYSRLLQRVSDFLRVQRQPPLVDDIAAIDALADEDRDFDFDEEDSPLEPLSAPVEEIAPQPELPPTITVVRPEPPAAAEIAQPELLLSLEVAQPEPRAPVQIVESAREQEIAVTGDQFVFAAIEGGTTPVVSPPTDSGPPEAIEPERGISEPVPDVAARDEQSLAPPAQPIEAYIDKLDALGDVGSDEGEESLGAGKLSHTEALRADGDEESETPDTAQPPRDEALAAGPVKSNAPPLPTSKAQDALVDAALSFSYFGIVREFNGLKAKMRAPAPRPASKVSLPTAPAAAPVAPEAKPELSEKTEEPVAQQPRADDEPKSTLPPATHAIEVQPELQTPVEARPRDWDWDVVGEHASTAHEDSHFAGLVTNGAADVGHAAKDAEDALDRLRDAIGPEPSNLNPATDSDVADCLAAQLKIPEFQTPPVAVAQNARSESDTPKSEAPDLAFEPAETASLDAIPAAAPVHVDVPLPSVDIATPISQPDTERGSLRDVIEGPRAKSAAPERSWFRKVADYFSGPQDAASVESPDDENAYLPRVVASPSPVPQPVEYPQPVEDESSKGIAPTMDVAPMPRGIDAPATVRAGWEQYREALDRLRDALKSNGHVATVGELHLAEHVTASLKKPLAAEVPLESTPQSALEAIEPAVEPARESRPAPRADMVFVQHATPPAPQGSAPSPDTAPRYADHLALDIAAPRQEPGAMPATGLSVALPQVAPEISVLVTSIADAAPAEQPHIVVQPSADLPVREEKQHEVEATQTAPVAVDVAPLPPPEKPVLQIQEPSPASRATADQPALKAPETAAPVASPAQPRKRERATKRGEAAAAPPQQRARPEPARENAEPEGEIIDLKLPLAAEPAARLQISGDAEDAVMDLKPPTPASPPKERTEPVVHAPKLSDEDVIDLKLPPSAPAPPPAALPSDEPEPTPVLPAVKPSNDSKSAELVRPTRQYRNGLERLRIGVKIDETQPPGSETAEGAQGAAEQPPPAQARATASSEARATGPVVKLGFDRKQPRRDFAPQNPKSANAATPKGVAPNGAKGAAPSADTSSAAALASALADYFGKLGRPQPPMHMTDREGYKKLLQTGHLEAPYRGRSTWSFSGMLAKGEVAIRLKPGADKFVELVPSIETFGQIPQFYPRGVGIGECRGTVPTEQLQYFDIPSRQWLAVKR